MRLHVLGSNSFGNCYLLESDTEALIVEAGVRLSDIKKALKWNISKVVGAVISHEHNDHAGYVSEFINSGIYVLANERVFSIHRIESCSFRRPIEAGKGYKVGGFKIIPFNVVHDVPCYGFLIDHNDIGRILFITDTMMCEYTFPGLNHIMIECNYAMDILDKNIESGKLPMAMRSRLLQSHMELSTTKDILESNDLSDVVNIILIHLSDGNSDEERFVREIQEITGKTVYAADKRLEVELLKTPY